MRFSVKFYPSKQSFPIIFKGLQTVTRAPDVEIYDGLYDITPKTDEAQTLQTAQKYLTQNVKVGKIPYFDVSNTAGGSTVYIGNEVE